MTDLTPNQAQRAHRLAERLQRGLHQAATWRDCEACLRQFRRFRHTVGGKKP